MSSKIWLSKPHLSGKEISYVKEALKSNWISTRGEQIDSFEEELAKYLNSSNEVVALNSGTSALHLALFNLGVGFGDEVLCQTFTFCASANPILYLKATPIFIDSEVHTWNMNPYYLRKAILDRLSKGKKPKAIIAVNTYGMPAKWDEFKKISKEFEIPLIEDSAEALGSSYKGKKCGLFGDYSFFSFNGNKIITTSSGGALILNGKQSKQRLIHLASQSNLGDVEYIHKELGFNYRMSNLLAAVGRGQLEDIEKKVSQRIIINTEYKHLLRHNSALTFHKEYNKEYYSNYWLSCLLIDKPIGKLLKKAKKENIELRRLWKPLHTQKLFNEALFFGENVSQMLYEKGICLPSSSDLTSWEQFRVVDLINNTIF